MFMHYLLTLYRSLSRHLLYAALNVFGLAIGVAVFLVLTLIVHYESNYDRWLPDSAGVYRLDVTYSPPGAESFESAASTFAALPFLLSDYHQIVAATRVMTDDEPVSVGTTISSETVSYVDPDFLRVIELKILAGDRAHALSSPGSVVISARTAEKYFGSVDAMGKTLTIARNGVKANFTVSAVVQDLPADTTLQGTGLITGFTPAIVQDTDGFKDWGEVAGYTYLRFHNPGEAASVSATLGDFVRRHTGPGRNGEAGASAYVAFSLVALTDVHFYDAGVRLGAAGVDKRVVFSLGAVGILGLALAVINYLNLATARSGLRAREVALRKVMGATRTMLLLQFMGEAVALVAVAAVIGTAMAELTLPFLNVLGGWSVTIDYGRLLVILVLLVLVVGSAAGAYPAILLAAFNPAMVLASARTPAGGRLGTWLRSLLVLAQFAGAIGFAICTLVIDRQAAFLRDADRGFVRQGLIVVDSLSASELLLRQNVMLDAFRRVPGVVSATVSDAAPGSSGFGQTEFTRPGLAGTRTLVHERVGRNYFVTYGIQKLAGRVFDDAHPLDDSHGFPVQGRTYGTVINAGAAAALGFASPAASVGQVLNVKAEGGTSTLVVDGVVADVRFRSPRDPIAPQFYLYDSQGIASGVAAIRFSGVSPSDITPLLQDAWRTVASDTPFAAKTVDERLADYYMPDQQQARLFSSGAALAVAIACLGLYGLASFNTARRVREIGIRKTLGAATGDILWLLIFQFIQPVLVANLIAWPVAWFAMRSFLAGFDQRIGLSPLYFATIGLGSLVISIATVFGQAWLVARAEPARALRYE